MFLCARIDFFVVVIHNALVSSLYIMLDLSLCIFLQQVFLLSLKSSLFYHVQGIVWDLISIVSYIIFFVLL